MTQSQADIDALLAEAETLAQEAVADDAVQRASAPAAAADAGVAVATAAPAPARPKRKPAEPDLSNAPLERILRLEVPVIVRLAECKMTLSKVLGLAPGAIIEFEKPADASLDLMINNKCIGNGQAVKVGENFGLRVGEIGTMAERVEAMGTSK